MGIYDSEVVDPFVVAAPVVKQPGRVGVVSDGSVSTAGSGDSSVPGVEAVGEFALGDVDVVAVTQREAGLFVEVDGGRRVLDDLRPLFTSDALAALEYHSGVGEAFDAALRVWEEDAAAAALVGERAPKKPKKPRDLSGVGVVAVVACLRLRERVQFNKDHFVSPNAVNKVRVELTWLVDADLMLRRDGVSVEQLADLIEWSTEDEFWRANVRSMPTLRKQHERLLSDRKFLLWREMTGRVAWDPLAVRLAESMVLTLDHLFPAEGPHVVDPAWVRGASVLLRKYSVTDVEDMMLWGVTSRVAAVRLPGLLTSEWVAAGFRRDPGFFEWSVQRKRGWALGARVPAAVGAAGGRRGGRMLDTRGNSDEAIRAAIDASR